MDKQTLWMIKHTLTLLLNDDVIMNHLYDDLCKNNEENCFKTKEEYSEIIISLDRILSHKMIESYEQGNLTEKNVIPLADGREVNIMDAIRNVFDTITIEDKSFQLILRDKNVRQYFIDSCPDIPEARELLHSMLEIVDKSMEADCWGK